MKKGHAHRSPRRAPRRRRPRGRPWSRCYRAVPPASARWRRTPGRARPTQSAAKHRHVSHARVNQAVSLIGGFVHKQLGAWHT
eukprot:10845142-Alexandrium_andersonii.AAC.1